MLTETYMMDSREWGIYHDEQLAPSLNLTSMYYGCITNYGYLAIFDLCVFCQASTTLPELEHFEGLNFVTLLQAKPTQTCSIPWIPELAGVPHLPFLEQCYPHISAEPFVIDHLS